MKPAAKPTLTLSSLDAAERRRLAVEARCDPRTIVAVVQGRPVRGLVADRAREALARAGYTVPAASITARKK